AQGGRRNAPGGAGPDPAELRAEARGSGVSLSGARGRPDPRGHPPLGGRRAGSLIPAFMSGTLAAMLSAYFDTPVYDNIIKGYIPDGEVEALRLGLREGTVIVHLSRRA